MARFAAPAHVSSVFLASGEYAVADGFVELPDAPSEGDLAGLAANGFVAVEEDIPSSRSSRAQSRDVSVAQRVSTGLDTNGMVADKDA